MSPTVGEISTEVKGVTLMYIDVFIGMQAKEVCFIPRALNLFLPEAHPSML